MAIYEVECWEEINYTYVIEVEAKDEEEAESLALMKKGKEIFRRENMPVSGEMNKIKKKGESNESSRS